MKTECCTIEKPCKEHVIQALGELVPDYTKLSVINKENIPRWVSNNFEKEGLPEEGLVSAIKYMAQTGILVYDGKKIEFEKPEEE